MKRRGMFIRLAVAVLVLSAGWGGPARAVGPDYQIDVPFGWHDTVPSGVQDLVRRIMEPAQNAFVEVYAGALTQNLVPAVMADNAEMLLRSRGMPYSEQRFSSVPTTLPPGVPGVIRRYGGHLNGVPLGAIVLYTHYGGSFLIVVGVFAATRPDLERAVTAAVTGVRFSGAATPPVSSRRSGDSFFGR